ncbi:MAG: universal stress protein [Solirubrobacterales bacterium]
MFTGYKSILVPMSDAASAVPALESALRMASDFSSHVIGLHVRPDPTAAVPLMGEGMSGAMVEEMLSAAEKQAAERAAAARRAFDEICARHGVPLVASPPAAGLSAEWIDVTGREEELVAWRGRLSDLVAMVRPENGAEVPSLMTLNAALMESGRPLLLAPPELPATMGTRVAIAWNGSAESGRAVAAAMPFLQKAGHGVVILSIAEDDRTANVPAGELAAYLAWHDVKAECRVLTGAAAHTGEVLLAECRSQGADLLVMGAYTHSRLRQLILGGVTRHVLHHADVCCLLSH